MLTVTGNIPQNKDYGNSSCELCDFTSFLSLNSTYQFCLLSWYLVLLQFGIDRFHGFVLFQLELNLRKMDTFIEIL